MNRLKIFSRYLIKYLKGCVFIYLIISMTGCGVVIHRRSVDDRKRGLMMLENTSRKKGKKIKRKKTVRKKVIKKKHGRPVKANKLLRM